MNRFRKRSSSGFTLIELLVVVAIIGILATIALAQLNRAREQAQWKRMTANIRSLQNGLELYYLDNNEYPHPDGFEGTMDDSYRIDPQTEGNNLNLDDLKNKLDPYIDVERVFGIPNEYLQFSIHPNGTCGGRTPPGNYQSYSITFNVYEDADLTSYSNGTYTRGNGSFIIPEWLEHSSVNTFRGSTFFWHEHCLSSL